MEIDDLQPTDLLSRRAVLTGAVSLGAAGALNALAQGTAIVNAQQAAPALQKGAVILFQGDSITDAGRNKKEQLANDANALGRGYPALAAGLLLADYAELELQIHNRGISGNKVPDLAERWQADAVDLKPTILSILIGVNDLWHTVAFGSKYKGTVDDYETGYRDLIKRSQNEIPGVRIIICEPFTLRDWPALDPYRVVSKKLADELKLTFVPFHSMFTAAAKAAPPTFWMGDGIHPSPAGHALMARAWRKAVGV